MATSLFGSPEQRRFTSETELMDSLHSIAQPLLGGGLFTPVERSSPLQQALSARSIPASALDTTWAGQVS